MGKDLNGKELGANLSQRKDGRYEAKYTDNFGKRHSIYGAKLNIVRKQLNEALYKVEHNIYSHNVQFTLDEWFDIWINNYKKRNIKETTLNRYIRYYKNNVKNFIGNMKLSAIKQIHIQSLFNNEYNSRLSQSTQRHLYSFLRSIFNYAVINDYIAKNPVVNIIFNSSKNNTRVLSLEEQQLFLKYARGYTYYNLYVFLIYTGCRIGEALALTWADIDFENNHINISKTYGKNYNYTTNCTEEYTHSPKTSTSERVIPMHDIVKAVLCKMKTYNSDCHLVFHTKNNTHLRADDVWNNIQVITKKINKEYSYEKIRNFSPHSLRHTFATNCFESNINAKVVQSYLGHTNLKMTMDLYTHVSQEKKQQDIKKLKGVIDELC